MQSKLKAAGILALRPEGLYCAAGDVYIDPLRKVGRAVITHAHADHARPGHAAVLATQPTLDVMRTRYGTRFAASTQAVRYGERVTLGDATVSLHPAGHVLGSAQVCIEVDGHRIVVSGDYKRTPDPTCTPFEPVRCDIFVTEATFGLPVYRHPPPQEEIARLRASLEIFEGRTHHVAAYSLGKAQRLMGLLRRDGYDEPIGVDPATDALCEIYEQHGVRLGPRRRLHKGMAPIPRLVIAPPGSGDSLRSPDGPAPITSFASGWMRLTRNARQRGGDLPLVISDHADWPELLRTIADVSPQELWITHGEEAALVAWATRQGLPARPLAIAGYGDEDAEPAA